MKSAHSVSRELTSVPVHARPVNRFRDILDPDVWTAFRSAIHDAETRMRGRRLWNVNSTAHGGGVAEMLSALIPYWRGCGIDARWVVIQGSPAFFAVTKRLHNQLHGADPDGNFVADADLRLYTETLAANVHSLAALTQPGDVVILHDPQTLGLVRALLDHGCRVVWRCHIGVDQPNDVVRRTWKLLREWAAAAEAVIFSRQAFAWEGLDPKRVSIIAPSIDAFTPKNQDLDAGTVSAILGAAGFNPGGSHTAQPAFHRGDGSPGTVRRRASFIPGPPPPGARLVVQVSRWDRLKDPAGVLQGFAGTVATSGDAHLVLAGPAMGAVNDDPEGEKVFAELEASLGRLDRSAQARIHLASLPMEDGEENAAIVNALQRRAEVVVQKSLAEGFGLTVAEAMWKSRPVVASRVGGIQDQIEDGKNGMLLDDPADLEAFGRCLLDLLRDPQAAQRIGAAAHTRVGREFLVPRQLTQKARLLIDLLS